MPKIQGGSVGVHPLWVLFATLAATALYGIIGAVFAVPIVAIIAATLRYLRGTPGYRRGSERSGLRRGGEVGCHGAAAWGAAPIVLL